MLKQNLFYRLFATALLLFGVLGWGQTTLPVSFDGGKSSLPTGFTQSGLGNDYGSSPKLKFDDTGDNLILNFTGTPGSLTYKMLGNSLSGTYKFTIQESDDGSVYTTLRELTSITSSATVYTDSPKASTRYIKWIYTTKSNGNVALGSIGLTAGSSNPPVVTAATVNGTVGVAINYQVVASNAPTSYALVSGNLPDGLSLNTTTGVISGTPTVSDLFFPEITATNTLGTSTPATISFEIDKGTQTIASFVDTGIIFNNQQSVILPTSTDQGVTVVYTSSNPSIASISGNILTFSQEGSVQVTASAFSNTNYNALSGLVKTFIASSNCFSEDFSSITDGDNTTSSGSNTVWAGNSNFTVIDKAYKAGGAVKIGSNSNSGSIKSPNLTTIGGTVTVGFSVKGWTTVEGNIEVTLGGQPQTVTYTAKMADPFENKSLVFNDVPLNSQLEIKTSIKRAFIDNVTISCGTATAWQSTNSWSNGAPSATKDAVIDADYSGAGFTAKSVTVNTGKSLVVTSDAIETGAVTNNGTITVKDDANFKHSSYSGSGTFTLEKATTADVNKYVFWSSPVAAQNMYSIYTSLSPFVMTYNTATDYYDTLANPTAAAFGTGYSVKVPVAQGLATFTGVPNSGTQSVTISNTPNANGNAYNLIGNPYPTNLDLAAFYLANTSNVGETFYFWNSSTGNNTTQTGAATGNPGWAVYNANTTTWSSAASGSNEIIRPGQAFIVKGLTTSVVFNDDMRTTTNTGVSFLNRVANAANQGKYWLQMTNPANTYTTIAVTYGQGASNAFDAYDSKMMSVSNDAIYSTVSNAKLAIQGRADFVNTDVVVLGNKFAAAGNYTISLAKVSGLFENGQAIYLRDKQLNTYTDLTVQGYSFAASTGEFLDRFEIVYQPQGSLATTELKKDELKIYKNAEVFVVENSINIDSVVVLDASGRMVKTLRPRAKKAEFELSAKGVYLVKVISGGKEQTKKIIK